LISPGNNPTCGNLIAAVRGMSCYFDKMNFVGNSVEGRKRKCRFVKLAADSGGIAEVKVRDLIKACGEEADLNQDH
jgi:hypothetical protein